MAKYHLAFLRALLLLALFSSFATALHTLDPRANRTIPALDPKTNQTSTATPEFPYYKELCEEEPDSDIAGLGVRTRIWLQCCALVISICSGCSRVTSALPAALVSILVYNIVLSMKLSIHIFGSYPVVQDFWVAHGQLWLLVTILPYAMLFGLWDPRTMGINRNVLFLVLYAYTYGQALWFWITGWPRVDEVVCGTAESVVLHGSFKMFAQNGRFAMIVLYGLGVPIMAMAMPTYLTSRPGICSPLIRRVRNPLYCAKAGVLVAYCVPLCIFAIWLVESTVRRGREKDWLWQTGQWLALGVGVGTFLESLWYLWKGVRREVFKGERFCNDLRHLGGDTVVREDEVHTLHERLPRGDYK
jgi:hypothetical protein